MAKKPDQRNVLFCLAPPLHTEARISALKNKQTLEQWMVEAVAQKLAQEATERYKEPHMSETIPSLTPANIVDYVLMICEAASPETFPTYPGRDTPYEQLVAYRIAMDEHYEYEDHCLHLSIEHCTCGKTDRPGYNVVIYDTDESHEETFGSAFFDAADLPPEDVKR